jgi:multicomponent Na+:H+ antiporter subunit G
MIEVIRAFIAAVCILAGTAVMLVAAIGVNRFHYVLNRMHAAALGDTLGIGLVLLGLMVHNGLTFVSLKLLLIIIFFWNASPVCSHLISNLEVQTNPDLEKECEIHYE